MSDISYFKKRDSEEIYNFKDAKARKILEQFGNYTSIEKRNDYTYDTWYDFLDYKYAEEYYKEHADIPFIGGCSAIKNGNIFGGNLDYIYSNRCEFTVFTPRLGNRFATFGISGNLPDLTKTFVESGEYSEQYKLVPFQMFDGFNEKGVVCKINVVPKDKGSNISEPLIEEKDRVCASMLVRFVIDNFATAQEAVNYIRDYTTVYFQKELHNMDYEAHFMIADSQNSYVLEFVNNRAVIIESNYMTNFYLDGVSFNSDGGVYTPETQDETHNAMDTNGITENGSGLERWNLINSGYSETATKQGMRSILDDLTYTKTYSSAPVVSNPFWYTEYVGEGLTVKTPYVNFSQRVTEYASKFSRRVRDGEEITWQTNHSVIYDIFNKKAYVIFQEDGVEIEYTPRFGSSDLPKVTPADEDKALMVDGAGKWVAKDPGVNAINAKIPSQASVENQLADKNFVNSSINNMAAFYITKNAAGDPFSTYAELMSATVFYNDGEVRVPTKNDYAMVLHDETKATETESPTTRYSYTGSQFQFQYIVNNSGLTAAQLATLNSGFTAADKTKLDNLNEVKSYTLYGYSNLTQEQIAYNASVMEELDGVPDSEYIVSLLIDDDKVLAKNRNDNGDFIFEYINDVPLKHVAYTVHYIGTVGKLETEVKGGDAKTGTSAPLTTTEADFLGQGYIVRNVADTVIGYYIFNGKSGDVNRWVRIPLYSDLQSYVDGKIGELGKVYVDDTEPEELEDGDIWINTSASDIGDLYVGSTQPSTMTDKDIWMDTTEPQAPAIAPGSMIVPFGGEVYEVTANKSDKSAIVTSGTTFTAADNTEYRFGEVASLTMTFPVTIPDRFDTFVAFTSGTTATAFTFPAGIKWSGDDITDGQFVPAASKRYNIALWYDGEAVNGIVRGAA